jgi:hypothetical protein
MVSLTGLVFGIAAVARICCVNIYQLIDIY